MGDDFMCRPLYLPPSLDDEERPEEERPSGGPSHTLGRRVAKWGLSPLVGLLGIAKALRRCQRTDRAEIERQLRERASCSHFPEAADATPRMDPGARNVYRRLKRMIRRELAWPNALFLPDDPVRLLFIPITGCFDDTYCITEIEDQFGIELSQATLDDCSSMTLGQFAAFVASRQAARSSTG